ncbi:MAG: DUF3334 family protein [Gammaproteobacteria bacterium]|nr:DUF3334 family protein [Gammaproteobacteria bacterium]
MTRSKIVSTEDVLVMLCKSVTEVLTSASASNINYSAIVQKINKTCLKPDIGCFVLFDGGFSGLVVINFPAAAAMEIYRNYLSNMGIPAEELATQHTADEVGNVLGELMNQIVGDFTGKVGHQLLTTINQNQPKMLTINKELILSINTNLDRPQARRVSFTTEERNIFYLEFSMDKTEFIKLPEYKEQPSQTPDEIIENSYLSTNSSDTQDVSDVNTDLLDELGI